MNFLEPPCWTGIDSDVAHRLLPNESRRVSSEIPESQVEVWRKNNGGDDLRQTHDIYVLYTLRYVYINIYAYIYILYAHIYRHIKTYNYIFVVLFCHTFEYSDHYKVKKLVPQNTVHGSEILHQLRLVVYPIGYKGFFTSQAVSRISFITSINLCPPGGWSACSRFLQLWTRIANTFEPDLVLVSAGFDAAPGDPLGPGLFWGRCPEDLRKCLALFWSKSWKHRSMSWKFQDITWRYPWYWMILL